MKKVLKAFSLAVLILVAAALIPSESANAKKSNLYGDQFFQYRYDFEKDTEVLADYMLPYNLSDFHISTVGNINKARLPLYVDADGSFVMGLYFMKEDDNAVPDDGEQHEYVPVDDTEIEWYSYEFDDNGMDDGIPPREKIEVTSQFLGEIYNERDDVKVKVYRFTLPKTFFDPDRIYAEGEISVIAEVTKFGTTDAINLNVMNSPLIISENEDCSKVTRNSVSVLIEEGQSKSFYINNLVRFEDEDAFEPSIYSKYGPAYYVQTKDKKITEFTELAKYITIEECKPYARGNDPKDNLFKITLNASEEPYTVYVPWAFDTGDDEAFYYCEMTRFYVSPAKATLIKEVPATCEKPGCKAYYQRGSKYYTDEACKNEIKDLDAWAKNEGLIKATGHKWVKPTLKKAKYCKTCGKVEGYPLFKVKDLTYNITKKSGKSGRVEVYAIKNTVKKITIPRTVTYKNVKYEIKAIADGAFKNNKKLEEINLGKRTYTIGEEAFKGCTNLKKVDIDFSVRDIGKSAFENCKKLTTVNFGKKTATIGDKAFAGCTALKSVTIPSKVKTIGNDAFKNDKKLKEIVIKSKKLKTVGKNAFKGINKKATVKVPSSKKKAYAKLLKDAGIGKKQVK